jgi:hypothetical protein
MLLVRFVGLGVIGWLVEDDVSSGGFSVVFVLIE